MCSWLTLADPRFSYVFVGTVELEEGCQDCKHERAEKHSKNAKVCDAAEDAEEDNESVHLDLAFDQHRSEDIIH